VYSRSNSAKTNKRHTVSSERSCTRRHHADLGNTTSGPGTHLIAQLRPVKGKHGNVNRVSDERFVIHQLVRCEGRDGFQEQDSGGFKIPNRNRIKALINFQSIPSVPITTFLNEPGNEFVTDVWP